MPLAPAPSKPAEKSVGYLLKGELLAAVIRFREDQDVTPSNAAVVTTAIREFLEKRGYLPKRHDS